MIIDIYIDCEKIKNDKLEIHSDTDNKYATITIKEGDQLCSVCIKVDELKMAVTNL